MKKLDSDNQKYYIPLIIIIIIFLLTTVIFGFYLNHIRNLITENTYKNLAELTKLDVSKLSETIEEHERILGTIVNVIEQEKPRTEEEIFKIYLRNSGKSEFSRMGILYKDGKTSTSDNEVVDLSNEVDEFFSTEEIQISKSRKSKVDEQEINIYSKKTLWNNQEVVILLVVETDKFEEIFSHAMYNGNGAEYIISDDGQIVANSRGEQNENNIFKKLEENSGNKSKKNKQNLEKFKREIKNEEIGQIRYEIRGQNYYIAYQDLGINHWNLIIITSGSAIAEELNQLLNLTFLISVIIIIIVIIISTYIIFANIKKRKRLYQLAYIDPVTRLGNYNYFIFKGKEFLDIHKLNKYIIVLDIDKFKSFNKKYGHDVGSKLLYIIGQKMENQLGRNSIICRLANDMFGIIIETKKDILNIIKELENNLKIVKVDNKEYKIYISVGIYNIKDDEKEVVKLLDKALIPHSLIKGNYDVQYKIFDEKVEKEIEKEHEIEVIMEEALQKNEFEIYYQPKISTIDEKLHAAEALVRWKRHGEIISPSEFIPIFEKNQFIIKLDTYIFKKVCKDLSDWKKQYGKIPLVSVNVSKEHFIKEDFINEYIDITKKYELEPKEIEIEITESASIDENIDIIEIMNKIKSAGFEISIDDFGTGYSSLSMLQNMPVNTLKIDKSFIDKIDLNNKGSEIVEFILLLSKELNLRTVAEGVETEEQLIYLKKLGCDLIQGYYYSKPLNKEEFERYMNNKFI